jgi:hypothetical protein
MKTKTENNKAIHPLAFTIPFLINQRNIEI